MAEPLIMLSGVRQAFADYDRRAIHQNVQLGCLLGIILMPVGALLDHWTYPERLGSFFLLRVISSILIGVFWLVVRTPFGRANPRGLGVLLAMFPAFFMTLMIYYSQGASSPYYAGLNLVLLVVGLILHWTLVESLVAVSLVIAMYLGACALSPHPIIMKNLIGNLYFMVLTGVIIVWGSHAHSQWRFREFVTRYELDTRTQELERTIRRLREAEAQLVQQEKMASLGVLSAGIIHEINNPLNFAATGLFSLRKTARHLLPDQQADYQEVLNDVEEGLNRVKHIVSDLRQFTHPDTKSLDDVVLEDTVTSAVRFLASELKAPIRLECELQPGLTVHANKSKLIHVLTNLLQNAVDALRSKTNNGEPPTIHLKSQVQADQVVLTVRDNGPGITPENLGRAFDPFFTTKEVGKGMGLGLSICYRLMQEFKGEISVDSELGRFCQFTLRFPLKNPAPATH